MHHSRHSSGRASLKIGDTWCLMHTSATVLLTRPRCDEHISHTGHTAAPLALSGPNPWPILSHRLVLQSAPHHPISELRISELPRSKQIPPSFLAPSTSLQAPFSPLTTPTSVKPTSVAMGLRLAPASLPSHSTMLLHTLHKKIRGFRHGAAHRAPLSLLPAAGRETLHPALAAGQAHCSSELLSLGAASTPARRGRPGEGERHRHLLQ